MLVVLKTVRVLKGETHFVPNKIVPGFVHGSKTLFFRVFTEINPFRNSSY